MRTTRRAFRRPPRLTRKQRVFLQHRLGRSGKTTPADQGVVSQLLDKRLLRTERVERVSGVFIEVLRLTRRGREALVGTT